MKSRRRSAAPSGRSCRDYFMPGKSCRIYCETFMKTFEEKWTAWLDGELRDRELAEFEASLPDKAVAEAEKEAAHKLGALLKEQLGAHAIAMRNDDFFSHQLSERIARESRLSREPAPEISTWWTVRRLLWTGAASLALFLICAVF